MEAFRQATKHIHASDVVSLLREVYPEGVRGRNEAEALIAFDREFPDPAPEWHGFMAEAVTDHLLRRSQPYGVLTAEKAEWLMHAVAPSGRIATRGGIETLVRTIKLADVLPVSLAAFAIRELWARAQALDGTDVALLRRILEAGTGAVTGEEAEALFDLHDTVAGGANHRSFDDLMFRAIANFLMGASDCETLPRVRALAREPGRDAGKNIAAEHCAWLSSRIMRDGKPTAAEHALLTLIGCRTEPDPSLRRFFNHAA